MITGTPGAGKTSTSRLLASRMDAKLVELGELIEKEKLFSGYDKRRGTLIANMRRISERIQEIIANSDRDLIIVGHFAAEVIPRREVHLLFVLRRDPEELKVILEKRGFKEGKVWENIAAEVLDVCLWDAINLFDKDKVCEINVTGREVEEVVEEIISILNMEKECRCGWIDWLGKLDAEGKIDEFLKHF